MTPPPGHLDFTVGFRDDGTPRPEPKGPRAGHILFAASYSGAPAGRAGATRPAARSLPLEELDAAFRAFAVTIAVEPLAAGGAPTTYSPSGPEDLHPDALLANVPGLADLWEATGDLEQDRSAAARLQALLAGDAGHVARVATEVAAPPAAPGGVGENADAMLARLLGSSVAAPERGTSSAAGRPGSASAEAVVQRLAQHVSAGQQLDPALTDLRAAAEAELGRRLRALLRQAEFRAVASRWQATEMVVRACPDDGLARFSAVDASFRDLVDPPGVLHTLLASASVSVLLVDHYFAPEATEMAALVTLVRTCAEHGVFLVTGATAELAGGGEFRQETELDTWPSLDDWQSDWAEAAQQAWAELGSLRESGAQFALVLPRCLVRQPFGKQGDRLDAMGFEEIEDPRDHESFAWANGAYLVARALMEQWCGGRTLLDGSYELKGLPVVTVADGDGLRMQPPIEAVLTSSEVQRLLDQGFSVIQFMRNTDRARVHL